MSPDAAWLAEHIRDIPDFPEPGIAFKDIAPLLADVDAFRFSVDAIVDHFATSEVDHVIGIEARGFILGAPVAYRLAAGFVPVRKPGKLPFETAELEYELEYGTDTLEIHVDAVGTGDRVLIVDDVLATGGTALATAGLVEKVGGKVIGLGFLLEIGSLGGREKLAAYDTHSLLTL